jgi:dTDP-4-amino-4,6-dideoxygalactose transaminase
VTLPLFAHMTAEQQDRVVEAIAEALPATASA